MGFGLINFVFALVAVLLIDRVGRRPLLLFTLPCMALCHLAVGLSFLSSGGTTLKVTVILFAYLFDLFYSVGQGPIPFVYASECMPLYVRDLGMSVATSVNWIFNWLLAFTFTKYWDRLGPTGTFCFFSAFCVVGFFLVLFFLPETRGKSLEELDATFSVPTRDQAAYGWRQLRWMVGMVVRRRWGKRPELEVEFEFPGDGAEQKSKKGPRVRKIRFEKEKDERLGSVDRAT